MYYYILERGSVVAFMNLFNLLSSLSLPNVRLKRRISSVFWTPLPPLFVLNETEHVLFAYT